MGRLKSSEEKKPNSGRSENDLIVSQVTDQVERLLPDFNLFLVTLLVRGHKGSRVIEVYLDSESPVSISELARFSRMLDEQTEEVIDGAYRLEVSSPGAERPLTHSRQFPKHIGRKMLVQYRAEADTDAVVLKTEGVLDSTDDVGIKLRTKTNTVSVAYDQLIDGVVQLPW